MIDWNSFNSFQWDKGNIDKNYKKHQISSSQSEEAFLDEKAIALEDIYHSQKEKRYTLIGKTFEGTPLFIVFTVRGKKIRIISARRANKKEKNKYVQNT